MKHFSKDKVTIQSEILISKLLTYRKNRNFNPQVYLDKKSALINKYFEEYKIDSPVVAVSGGIDSAIVLGILNYAAKQKNSYIKNIYPLMIPKDGIGATNQILATNKGIELCNKFSLKPLVIDISGAFIQLKSIVENVINIKGDGWASGQLIPYLRTPTMYYVTSLLSQEGYRSVICGTTNKDEGEYLGYFGKASDGLVDLQLISDIHKSEVFSLAQFLDIPTSILNAIPTGDMFDGRVDEEVFGTTYDFVELFLYYKSLNKELSQNFIKSLDEESKIEFNIALNNLELLHSYNKHKYLGCSPAVHFDILKSNRINNGWIYNNYE